MRRRAWIPEEEEKLIELYMNSALTYEQIGEELNRSLVAVQCRIKTLQETGRLDYRKPNKRWTPEEEEKLIELWNTTTLIYEQIGSELNRDLNSVEHRIRKLRKAGILGYRNPKLKNRYEKDLTNVGRLTSSGAYFIMSVLGDGNLQKRFVQFFRKRDCLEFRNIISHILKISPPLHICWEKSRPIRWKKWKRKRTPEGYVGKFYVYSTELAELLAYTYGIPMGAKSGLIRLPRQLMKSADAKIHGAVMRAAFECEGGVNLNDKQLCITIGNTSILFLQDLSELFENYQIESNIYGIRLRISSLESILKFYEMAYSVFDLKLHITAKKKGLEVLIELRSKKQPNNR